VTITEQLRKVPDGVHRRETENKWLIGNEGLRWAVHFVSGSVLDRPDWGNEAKRQFLIVDDRVWALYGDSIAEYLDRHAVQWGHYVVVGGENAKTLETVHDIAETMLRERIPRSAVVVGVGGGVICDIAALVAQTLRRGMTGTLKIPTSLIGIVDAAVGVKCGVNVRDHKNGIGLMAGSVTLAGTTWLRTLPEEDLTSGIAEIVKMAIAAAPSSELFETLERDPAATKQALRNGSPEGVEIMAQAIDLMIRELQRNPWERIKQRPVDFGHAIGPLIERRCGIPHGYSVALDMALMAVLSAQRGLLSMDDAKRSIRLMEAYGLPVWNECFLDQLLHSEMLTEITAHRGGMQNLPLPTSVGTVTFVHDVSERELHTAALTLREIAAAPAPAPASERELELVA
jgi:3-dehydroquinate synthetase